MNWLRKTWSSSLAQDPRSKMQHTFHKRWAKVSYGSRGHKWTLKSLKGVFFPTCQLRVVRFYASHFSSSFFFFSSFFSFSSPSRLPRPRPSLATSWVQCSAPDLNRDPVSSVFRAGPQPRSCEISVPRRTSTAILWDQCSAPDLNRVRNVSERLSEDVSERMSKDMSERMSKDFSEDMSERMSKDVRKNVRRNVRRYVRKNVRRYVRRNVRKICQKICQKLCQKECQKICQKECQKICQKICQKECQKIC